MTTALFYHFKSVIANSATANSATTDLENGHTYGPLVSIHIARLWSICMTADSLFGLIAASIQRHSS